MTKTLKTICSLFVCALLVLTLASCTSKQKEYEKYAEEIRVAEAKGEAKSYAEVLEKLGTPTLNLTSSIFGSGETGSASWYADCSDLEAVEAKLEAGEEVPYIQVTFSGGKAVDAKAGVSTPDAE